MKPTVFNYQEYERVVEENKKLKAEVANLLIRCRIAEADRPEWIPVSEKPKDEERTYLVQLDGGGMCSCRWTNANPIWTELTTDWHWNIFDIPQYCKVVAWMDLEPYKGGDPDER